MKTKLPTVLSWMVAFALIAGPSALAQDKKEDGDLRRRVLESLKKREAAREEKPPEQPAPQPAAPPAQPVPVIPPAVPPPSAAPEVTPKPAPPAVQPKPAATPANPAPSPQPALTPPAAPTNPAAPPSAQPVAPSARTYTIRNGDTFSGMAQQFYGDEKHWIAIAKANPLVDPARLKVGQVIRLPDLRESSASREKELEEVRKQVVPGGSEKTVMVEPGDNLSKISQRVYGRANRWRILFDANRDQLDSPDQLEVGMKLKVPPLPQAIEVPFDPNKPTPGGPGTRG